MSMENFLDGSGRIKQWPAKRERKYEVLSYLAEKFIPGRYYTEKEVNKVIDAWHTFGDRFILRRGMIDLKLLKREPDGARYWRAETERETHERKV